MFVTPEFDPADIPAGVFFLSPGCDGCAWGFSGKCGGLRGNGEDRIKKILHVEILTRGASVLLVFCPPRDKLRFALSCFCILREIKLKKLPATPYTSNNIRTVATEIVAPVEALNMLQMFSARMVGPDSS